MVGDFGIKRFKGAQIFVRLVIFIFCLFFLTTHSFASSVRLSAKDHYLEGVAALESGAYGEAVLALQRALALNPNLGAARAALAEAYVNLGDHAAAARLYDQVAQAQETPPTLRPSFSQAATSLETLLKGGPDVTQYDVAVGVGYDSNANAAQSDDQILIPALAALGPANLSNEAQAQSSVFQNIDVGIRRFKPYSAAFGTLSSAQIGVRRNNNQSVSALNVIAVDYGVQYRTAENGVFALIAQGQQNLLGRSGYRRAATLAGQWQKEIAPRTVFALNTSYGLSSFTSENRDMGRLTVGGQLQHQFDFIFMPRLTVAGYGGRETASQQEFDYQDYNFRGLNLGMNATFRPDLFLNLSTGYEVRDFKKDYPLFLTPRDDREFDVSARMTYKISEQWSIEPSVRYTHAKSDVSLFTYDRTVTQIQTRWRF